jgi:hypothetical protein
MKELMFAQFYGSFTAVDEENEKIMAYIRSQGVFGYLIMLNWTTEDCEWTIPDDIYIGASVLMIANYEVSGRVLHQKITLRPYEARIYTLRP